MSKKYEIVNVSGVNRVRALRSWVVQGRQVNTGDVGGAVFDERTLSQDGDAWIFSGRFDNPLIRVGGDSVVNVGESTPSILPRVNITGTSSLDANFNVNFITSVINNRVPLTPAMMEQGYYRADTVGVKIAKIAGANDIRKTDKMFTGGVAFNIPAPATGYAIQAFAVDDNDVVVQRTAYVTTAINIDAGDHTYVYFNVAKTPSASIVPADVTAAKLTFPDKADSTINIVDSHITLTGQNAGYVLIDPSILNGENTTNIVGSTVNVTRTAGTPKLILACDLINTTASINMLTLNVTMMGVYKNVKNLVWSGIAWSALQDLRDIVQATDCDNFVMDNSNIDTVAIDEANAISTPYKFIRCNMNTARIVNQPKINNTYEDINFDLATADLRKLTAGSVSGLASSNVNGMYRLNAGGGYMGALVESYESVKNWNLSTTPNINRSYNTTVYADAYLSGNIAFSGTNVIGNAVKKPKERTQDASRMAVQGTFNTIAVGQTITGVVANATRVCVPIPFKLRGALGISVKGVTGAGLRFITIAADAKGVISSVSAATPADKTLEGTTQNDSPFVYLVFNNSAGSYITPADLAGVTVTTYNGSKVVNTKATDMVIAGNVRVEDNAVLKDVSVSGSGYFGGNSVTEAPTALAAPMPVEGAAFVRDNAVFSPATVVAGSGASLLDMSGNSVFAGILNAANAFYNITMADNADFRGASSTRSGLVMRGNSFVASGVTLMAVCRGLLVMNGKARVESGNLTAVGHITLTGDYRQTATKTWQGKRVIDSQDAPQYDNNVRTQYDF